MPDDMALAARDLWVHQQHITRLLVEGKGQKPENKREAPLLGGRLHHALTTPLTSAPAGPACLLHPYLLYICYISLL